GPCTGSRAWSAPSRLATIRPQRRPTAISRVWASMCATAPSPGRSIVATATSRPSPLLPREGGAMSDHTQATPSRGWTVPELAQLLRVGEDRIRGWIRRGELEAISTAVSRSGRPRYVVLPDALERWRRGRAVATAPPTPRRHRRRCPRDYYAD